MICRLLLQPQRLLRPSFIHLVNLAQIGFFSLASTVAKDIFLYYGANERSYAWLDLIHTIFVKNPAQN